MTRQAPIGPSGRDHLNAAFWQTCRRDRAGIGGVRYGHCMVSNGKLLTGRSECLPSDETDPVIHSLLSGHYGTHSTE